MDIPIEPKWPVERPDRHRPGRRDMAPFTFVKDLVAVTSLFTAVYVWLVIA